MRHVAFALAVALVSVGCRPAHAAPAPLVMRDYEVRLVGTVRAIDRHAHLVTVAYAPLETAPGGVRQMYVAERRALANLETGEAISGLADTRHSPWNLRGVRVLR